LARQNFSHGKRQRELAKKHKREEKLQRRLHKKDSALQPSPEQAPAAETDTGPADGGAGRELA
jgi:hypothetical protein